MSFGKALEFTLRWEGGYANHPNDPGGETYRGISRRAHPNWSGWSVVDGMSDLRTNQFISELDPLVGDFYKENYWDPVQGDDLPTFVAKAVFDHAVHSGVRRASQALQREVGAKVDGQIGDRTIEATWVHCDRLGAKKLISYRKGWLEHLATRPSLASFGRGWSRRIAALDSSVSRGE